MSKEDSRELSVLLDKVASLQAELQAEQDVALSRSTELDAQRKELQIQKAESDVLYQLIATRYTRPENREASLATARRVLAELQHQQQEAECQLAYRMAQCAELEVELNKSDSEQAQMQGRLDIQT